MDVLDVICHVGVVGGEGGAGGWGDVDALGRLHCRSNGVVASTSQLQCTMQLTKIIRLATFSVQNTTKI